MSSPAPDARERFVRPGRVLIVDDDATLRLAISHTLRRLGHEVEVARDGVEGLDMLLADGPWDMALCDIRMPRMDGLALLQRALEADPQLRIVMMTGHATVDTAVQALRLGATDYLTKPFEDIFAVCEGVVAAAIEQSVRARTGLVPALSASSVRAGLFEGMIGRSLPMRRLFEMIAEVGPSHATVLVQGETGTGKELVAAAVHRRSRRAEAAFLPLNCAALPTDLLESELFGHRRGAFTGADRDKVGLIEAADGGTLFLDEIAEMPLALQAKLLRVLESGELRRVGDNTTRKVDVRVVAATHRELRGRVAEGTFRQDLFYRLAVVTLGIPALRERLDDVEPLAAHFLAERRVRTGHKLTGLTPRALDVLRAHPWPGNVRELRNVMERAVIFARGATVDVGDLPDELVHGGADPVDSGELLAITGDLGDLDRFSDAKKRVVDDFEQRYVEALLESTGGNISAAARIAGLDRANFRRLLKRTNS